MRRIAQIRRYRSDLEIVELRGNVDTRLEKVVAGEVEAAVLALAGLKRLGLEERATESLAPELMLPRRRAGARSPSETREADAATRRLVEGLEHPETKRAVMAERVVNGRAWRVGASCPLPFFAEMRKAGFQIKAAASRAWMGSVWWRRNERAQPDDAARMAEDLAEDVLASGGAEILRDAR